MTLALTIAFTILASWASVVIITIPEKKSRAFEFERWRDGIGE